jgi:hypothetical protein
MKKLFTFILLINVLAISAQNITWTDISGNYSMPNGVKVFSGLDASIPLKLKYIDIDLNNADLELTPVLSSTITNAKNWATNLGAIAVMNGGFFGGSTSYSAVVNTDVEAKNVAVLNRSGLDYPVTRGFFGLNSDGTMAVNWIYHFGNTKADIYSYATPNPNADGSPAPTPTQAGGVQWTNLSKGMGAGPVLIKNGSIVDTYTEEVFWGSGVSNTGLDPRSALGYTANKHVILLVADGRQAGISEGASLPQMASILSNLGCVEALNFDGGGSSQLATPDAFINTPSESYRSVPSVWAIYKKANLETPVPSAPADQSSTQDNPVQLLWNMPTETGCTYRLQIATSKDNWNKQVGFTPSLTTNSTVLVNEDNANGNYNFSNLTLGNTYYWTVVALKDGGFKSYYSEPISFIFSNGVEINWKRASSDITKPTWFGTDTERGLAYANNKIYVVSRSSGTKVKILNCFDGTDLGELPMTGISGGTFSLNDIEASANGMLLGCNLTINTGSSNFKIYKWANETSDPEVYIDYSSPSNLRLGDKFTLLGDISTNAVILAAASGGSKVVRWLVINGALQTPTEITLPAAMGNQASATATGTSNDSDMIVNSIAKNIILYSSTGVNKGTLGNAIIDSDSNSTKYFELDGKKYLAIFQSKQTTGSPIGNNCRVLDITNGFASATIVATTDRLGDTTNGNAAGDVDVRYSTSPVSLTAITLATNNGISAKRIFGVVIENGSSNNTLYIKQNIFDKQNSISIYPNPVKTEFTISISKDLDNRCKIYIYSMEGKLIQVESILKHKQNINVDSLSKGIYLIKIHNGENHYQTKFIKS